jgi:hypothetical protein
MRGKRSPTQFCATDARGGMDAASRRSALDSTPGISDTPNGGSLSTPTTVTDTDFLVAVDYATTPDTTIGAACSAATGANGVRNDGDDKGFAMQGYYVP